MRLARVLSRNWGFLLACAIAAWAGLEASGKGTGVLKWLFYPPLTRDADFHPLDIVGARPKGPVRLTQSEAAAVEARLEKAYGARVPKHVRTSEMRVFYELAPDAYCTRERVDFAGCNKIERMNPFFAAVLAAMHPETEHLLWLPVQTDAGGPGRGEIVTMAMFLGTDETVKIALDLGRIKRSAEFKTYTVRASDSSGLRDLAAREGEGGALIVDDPGPLKTRRYSGGKIMVYGGANPPANAILGVMNEGEFVARHRFFSAVLGRLVGGVDASVPGPAFVAGFVPSDEPVHEGTAAAIRAAMTDSLGAARAAGVKFGRMSVIGGDGTFYGVVVDGARHVAVNLSGLMDRQRYEFFWDGPDGLRPVAEVVAFAAKDNDVRAALRGAYYLIPLADAGSAASLVVYRRGERGAPIAGMWPLSEKLAATEPLIESNP